MQRSRTTPSLGTLEDLQRINRSFDHMGFYESKLGVALLDPPPAEHIQPLEVTPDFFAMFDTVPALGRLFGPADRAARVTVISHGAWQRRFGGDPDVIGREAKMLDGARTVIGVLPAGFAFSPETDFWLPMEETPWRRDHEGFGADSLARLRPGVTLAAAQQDLNALASHLQQRGGPAGLAGFELRSVHEFEVGGKRPMLAIVMTAAGCVLLIASVNVASLLVARGAGRSRELAIRRSLGAARGRIVRQLVTESLVLGVAGGVLGILLAWASLAALTPILPVSLPSEVRPSIDLRVLGVSSAVTVLTSLLFGLWPAFRMSGARLSGALKIGGQVQASGGVFAGRALVAIQLALALVLLVGAGLMIRSVQTLLGVDPGFAPAQVLVLEVEPAAAADRTPERARQFYEELVRRLETLPGIRGASATDAEPFGSWTESAAMLERPHGPPAFVNVSRLTVSPGYFKTLGIPVKAGRDFAALDRPGSQCVVMVNEDFVRRNLPTESALGRRVRQAVFSGQPERPWCEIVGVVGNAMQTSLEDDVAPELYFTAAQTDISVMAVLARADDPDAVASMVRAAAAAIGPQVIIGRTEGLEHFVRRTTEYRQRRADMLSLLGLLGTLLSCVGIFGLTSYTVARRTSEIGVRVALGATGTAVVRTIVRTYLPAIVCGLALGAAGAYAGGRFLEAFVFGVRPTDPLTFVAMAALLGGTALVACYLPARKALSVDPVIALRQE
jgi:predicted permease